MARDRCSVLGLCLFVAYAFWGCASLRPSSQDAPMPFFAPSAEDASRLVLMTHELDEKARQCVDPVKCEQVSFARALVSLFESGDAARTSFRHLIERNPAGPLAGPSQLWLQIIDDQQAASTTATPSNPWTQVTAQLLRDWMDLQVSGQAPFERPARPGISSASAAPPLVQGLQRQLRERDRQITVLRSQLEALKYIDQEHAEKQRKVKPPASLRMMDQYGGPSVP